jgi:hypothetical protein
MQQLYNAIRNDSHADNVVIAGGLSYAYDLSGVASHPIQGYNIMYASHPYKSGSQTAQWGAKFGYLAEANFAPVIVTEFGDNVQNASCTGDWDTQLIQYADTNKISWTAWAWYVPQDQQGNTTLTALCSFPALISDWNATPSVQGVAVKAALAKYPAVVAPKMDAGVDATVADGAAGDGAAGDATLPDATLDDSGAVGGDAGADADAAIDTGAAIEPDADAVDAGDDATDALAE